MATVQLRFTALPAHVRTVRLVVAALARRVGVDESTLDEMRLAVDEACSRAVALHRQHCPNAAVTVQLCDDDDRLLVAVTDQAPTNDEHPHDPLALLDDELGDPAMLFPASLGIAVITGLVDDVEVRSGSAGSTVQMRWSVAGGNGLQPGPLGPS
jgi:anti-sigma regulatory factor (Ser/Thr protein kinase)